MKLFAGCAMAGGLWLVATAAPAQVLTPYAVEMSPYAAASDLDDPYVAMPPPDIGPRYAAPRYARPVLSPVDIGEIVRESGFAPLGNPRQRGPVYIISVINPDGDDGRLVIDARNGRIRQFIPAYRVGDRFDDAPPPMIGRERWRDEPRVIYGRERPLPPPREPRQVSRPVPHVASVPRSATPPVAAVPPRVIGGTPAQVTKPVAAKPAQKPAQQAVSTQVGTVGVAKSADGKPSEPPAVEMKPAAPAPQILPTQEMPAAQGLD